MMEKIYEGLRDPDAEHAAGPSIVMVNGQVLPLTPSLHVRNHSPTGFSWGYLGSGPAQLALAILLDYYGEPPDPWLYQRFKECVVAQWPQGEGWKLTGAEIEEVCALIRKERPGGL